MKTRTVHIAFTKAGEALPAWPGAADVEMSVSGVPNSVGSYELAEIISGLRLRGRQMEYDAIVAEKECKA